MLLSGGDPTTFVKRSISAVFGSLKFVRDLWPLPLAGVQSAIDVRDNFARHFRRLRPAACLSGSSSPSLSG